MESINKIKALAAAAIGALTALWGWLGWLVMGWIVCMALDYLTGSLAACKGGGWSSARAREGIWHKCGMVVVVLVAAGADLLIGIVLANLPGIDLPFQFSDAYGVGMVHHYRAGQHRRKRGVHGRAGAPVAGEDSGDRQGRRGHRRR